VSSISILGILVYVSLFYFYDLALLIPLAPF
jgi:hypothetical protein